MTMYNCYKYLLTAAILLLSIAVPVQAKAEATICFYSPDTNINNLASLKQGFDAYLSALGKFRFQPFADAIILDQFAMKQGCQLFMLSNEYFQKSKAHFELKKRMSGTLNGNTAQKKVLSSKSKLDNMKSLEGRSIASSSSVANTRKMLLKILGHGHEATVRSLKILEVPKDIDALMAINYGVAFAAVTTGATLDLLSSINPKQARALKRIGGSVDAPFPIIAVNKSNSDVQALLNVMGGMSETPTGRGELRLLGLDGFRELKKGSTTGASK